MRALLVGLGVWMACFGQQPPSIRVDVRLINVAFTVRNERGGFVTDLTKDDFEVLDDGVSQPISFFSRSTDLPLSLGLIVDVSGSQEHFVKPHEHDLESFLKSVLTPRDRAFMVCFGNHLRLTSDFSPSPKALLQGLKDFDHKRATFPEIGPPDERDLGTAFYDALYYSTTEKLASAQTGRRALIVFSDGEDNSSAHHMLDTIEAAQGENVVIFGIRYTQTRKGKLTARNKYGMRVMARLGLETGGADFDAEKENMKEAFRQISEQLRSSYELAYHAGKPLQDGTFHKLVVRCKRPELKVRAKAGYFARGE